MRERPNGAKRFSRCPFGVPAPERRRVGFSSRSRPRMLAGPNAAGAAAPATAPACEPRRSCLREGGLRFCCAGPGSAGCQCLAKTAHARQLKTAHFGGGGARSGSSSPPWALAPARDAIPGASVGGRPSDSARQCRSRGSAPPTSAPRTRCSEPCRHRAKRFAVEVGAYYAPAQVIRIGPGQGSGLQRQQNPFESYPCPKRNPLRESLNDRKP